MKRLLVILIILNGLSCKEQTKSETDELIEKADRLLDSIAAARKVDSMVKATMKSAYFDTSGISTAPVKILSTRIVKNEYSALRDIELTWKNVSNKKISAIRFKWYGVNAFNEPADMGSGFDGLGGGMSDDLLSPGPPRGGRLFTVKTPFVIHPLSCILATARVQLLYLNNRYYE